MSYAKILWKTTHLIADGKSGEDSVSTKHLRNITYKNNKMLQSLLLQNSNGFEDYKAHSK